MGINTSISPESPVLVVLAMMISGLDGFVGAGATAGVAAGTADGAATGGALAAGAQPAMTADNAMTIQMKDMRKTRLTGLPRPKDITLSFPSSGGGGVSTFTLEAFQPADWTPCRLGLGLQLEEQPCIFWKSYYHIGHRLTTQYRADIENNIYATSPQGRKATCPFYVAGQDLRHARPSPPHGAYRSRNRLHHNRHRTSL